MYLLTHLNEDTVHGTEKHAVLHLEAISETSRFGELVLFDSGDDLIHLALNLGLVGLVSTKLGEVDLGLLEVSALNVESRGFGSENSSEEDDTSEDELNGNGESPREGVVSVVERVVDSVSEEAGKKSEVSSLVSS